MHEECSTAEEWRAIPGYAGRYEASNYGRIRSLINSQGHPSQPHIMKQRISRRYLTVTLSMGPNGGERRTRGTQVSRLILEAFVGPCPEGWTCDHINRNRFDNRLENLRWADWFTQANNRSKPDMQGERHNRAKLNNAKVQEIRRRIAAGERPTHIAARFNVSTPLVSMIKNGHRWAFLEAE